jgi:hypothetical protein
MNCDPYRSEMYAWRPGSDEKNFSPCSIIWTAAPNVLDFLSD